MKERANSVDTLQVEEDDEFWDLGPQAVYQNLDCISLCNFPRPSIADSGSEEDEEYKDLVVEKSEVHYSCYQDLRLVAQRPPGSFSEHLYVNHLQPIEGTICLLSIISSINDHRNN